MYVVVEVAVEQPGAWVVCVGVQHSHGAGQHCHLVMGWGVGWEEGGGGGRDSTKQQESETVQCAGTMLTVQ
jgi:hypothetical protein